MSFFLKNLMIFQVKRLGKLAQDISEPTAQPNHLNKVASRGFEKSHVQACQAKAGLINHVSLRVSVRKKRGERGG
jgi:hypothetical protein